MDRRLVDGSAPITEVIHTRVPVGLKTDLERLARRVKLPFNEVCRYLLEWGLEKMPEAEEWANRLDYIAEQPPEETEGIVLDESTQEKAELFKGLRDTPKKKRGRKSKL